MTRTGAVVGSFPFMAPERHRGESAGVPGDIYSVGCLLWQLLTGSAPYVGTDLEVALAHLQAPVPQLPPTSRCEETINAVLARSMAKDPSERYDSTTAMRSDQVGALALAPQALVLPEVTALRHAVPSGPVSAAPSAAAASGPDVRRSKRRPVAVLATVLAVALPKLNGRVVYTSWLSVGAAQDALRSEFGGPGRWCGDWGAFWTRRAKQITRVNLYQGAPLSVRIVGETKGAHQRLIDQVSYRTPDNLRGRPIS